MHAQLEDLDGLHALNRGWPARNTHGQWIGFRVAQVEHEGPVWQVGVRDGDMLLSVNGMPVMDLLTNLEDLLALAETSSLALEVTRNGEPLVLEYEIVD